MKTLQAAKKITLATLKAFAKRNSENLFVMGLSKFDGMIDMVDKIDNPEWQKTEIGDTNYYETGIQGVYTVGNSRDYFSIYEDQLFFGINVYNCCGSSILAVEKTPGFVKVRDNKVIENVIVEETQMSLFSQPEPEPAKIVKNGNNVIRIFDVIKKAAPQPEPVKMQAVEPVKMQAVETDFILVADAYGFKRKQYI